MQSPVATTLAFKLLFPPYFRVTDSDSVAWSRINMGVEETTCALVFAIPLRRNSEARG